MLVKSEVIKAISSFPDNFSIDEIVEKLILLDKIDKGISQADSGKTLPEEEVDKKIEEWLK